MNFHSVGASKPANFASAWKKNIEGAPRMTVGENQQAVP
jgi:hypothetical protein